MKNIFYLLLAVVFTTACTSNYTNDNDVLVEAETFSSKGGWVLDQQFMDFMGSPYLLAHGMGHPVESAKTTVEFKEAGKYNVYVRTYNWVAPWHKGEGPGKFKISVAGETLSSTLGSKGDAWMWQHAGKVKVEKGKNEIGLIDLTGFDGRVDAIYFTQTDKAPTNDIEELHVLRKKMLGIPEKPVAKGEYDLVVVGGGVAGITASITAARLGLKVALIHNRTILGGNNSSEVRVHLGGGLMIDPYPKLGEVVNEIGPLKGGNAQPADYYEDNKKMKAVLAEPNITLMNNYHVYDVVKNGDNISAVHARNIETSEEIEVTANLFADCTGDGTVGYLAGADFAMGREAKSDYDEPSALDVADKMTMGTSIQWYSKKGNTEYKFPVFKYGVEFNEKNSEKVTFGEWKWETGMNYDQIFQFERIRDYGLLVVYSNWSFLKNEYSKKEEYANRHLGWVAYIGGKRESRRLLGDFVLKEQDIINDIEYPDASITTTWSIDLHTPDPKNTEFFPGNEFKAVTVHRKIHYYPIPYRCFYSRNVNNLFMAGRDISVTHIALGTIRVMRTTGMMGEVVGMAASVANKNNTNPRGVYENHLEDLKALMKEGVGKFDLENTQKYNHGPSLGPREK